MPRASPCRVQETVKGITPAGSWGLHSQGQGPHPCRVQKGKILHTNTPSAFDTITYRYPFCLWHHHIQIPLLPLTPSQYFEPILRYFYTSKFKSQVSWENNSDWPKVQNNGSLIDHRCFILLLLCGGGRGDLQKQVHCLCHRLKNESCSRALLLLVLLLLLLIGQHKTCEQFQTGLTSFSSNWQITMTNENNLQLSCQPVSKTIFIMTVFLSVAWNRVYLENVHTFCVVLLKSALFLTSVCLNLVSLLPRNGTVDLVLFQEALFYDWNIFWQNWPCSSPRIMLIKI